VTSRYRVVGTFTSTSTSITLSSSTFGTLAGSGLAAGMQVTIDGVTGSRTIASISGNTVNLSGGAIPTTLTGGTLAEVQIGGDDIVVTGGPSTLAAGGPGSPTCTLDYTTCTPSPLVIYGDTSQDGLWYGGDPAGITLHNFGPKPLPHDSALSITAAYVSGTPNGRVTRNDGGSFIIDGFAVGQLVTVDATAQQLTVGIANTGAITRNDGSWIAAGFALGQLIAIDGTPAGTVSGITATTLTLSGLTPSFASFVNTTPQNHLVSAAELGTVNAITKSNLTLTFLTANFTQLVGEGTSSHSIAVANRVGNGAPFFVFALADPFQYFGNDVIDAHLAFSKADPTNLPSIGITAYGGPGNDTIIGTQTGDILAGGSGNDTIMGGRGQNQILGDDGINVDPITRQLSIVTINSSSFPNHDSLLAGQDLLYGDMPGATMNDPYQSQLAITTSTTGGTGTIARADGGSWLAAQFLPGQTQVTIDGVLVGDVSAVTASTLTLTNLKSAFGSVNPAKLHVVSVAWYGNYDSIVIGDLGTVVQDVSGPRDTTKPLPALPQEIQTTLRVRTIQTVQPDNFANDTIYGSGGDNILIGGGGDDSISGGPGRDLIFGEDVLLDRSSTVTPYPGCPAQLGCFVSRLFQDLSGTQIYSTAIANEGQLLTDNLPQLDPRGHASWGDYRITQLGMDPNELDAGVYEGRNYIAGGPGNDMIFGGLGSDTIQGDGSIDYIAHPYMTGGQGGTSNAYGYASSCTNGGHPGQASVLQRVGACRDANNALLVNASVSRPTDGADYIEGGGGDNVIFGDGNQNDIIGGSSEFFGTGTPNLRSSGSNLIFGGSGTLLDREGFGDTSTQGHANNSDVIAANNADVIRLVGTNGTYGVGARVGSGQVQVAETGFLRYNYDTYTDALPLAQQAHIVVRGVRLLDYTPGGPDLAAQPGPLVTGPAATNGVGDIGGHPLACTLAAGETVATQPCQQQGSEIHSESGDAFVYGGPANDVIFGGGQNDTIITGYGDSWVSGGRGDQCILGGGGRCLTSRNGLSEPLYAVAAIPGGSLSQLITTPGNVQQAVINVAGALNYTAELFPYNWDPTSNGGTLATFSTGCKQNQLCPHYQPRYGHNIIYGGWGGGVIHGGPGQSAISGAAAPVLGYADNFDMNGIAVNAAALRTDFYHPSNPGNAMGWFPLADNGNGNAARALMAGKASYFDPEDPRRQIWLNPTVSVANGIFNPLDCKWTTGQNPSAAGCLPWFLTFDPTDPAMSLDNRWFPGTACSNGLTCAPEPVTGDKAIFGDLGNSWIVAGMGRVRVYGGWGNDVIDVRASTFENGGLNDGPVPNLVNNGNGTFSLATANYVFGTPAWETLAFGGAGQDIFFAGTGGDRLIDWVGNHNSYFVPFSQFGMPAVSRTLQPFLPEFLYALSKSDGADQLLTLRFAASDTRYSGLASRNGEPFGELSLVLQHDEAWHQQVGPPFNEMPENLGGTGIDVQKTANVRPFLSPGTDPPAGGAARLSLPSGQGVNLPSGTNTPGAGSVPLFVTGAPGASVSFKFTEGTYLASGTGTVGPDGTFGAVVDLSTFPDGVINVTVTLKSGGATTTLTSVMTKNSVPPPAPAVSPWPYVNLANQLVYNVTVSGQVGSIANVVLTDGGLPLPNVANGMDMIGTTGSITIPIDASNLADGPVTVSVSLTNGSGDSAATTSFITKDTIPALLQVSAPQYITTANVSAYQPVFAGENGATTIYSITDGTTTLTGGKFFNGSTKWQPSMVLTTLKNGPVTLTVTETDPAGNPTVVVVNLVKDTAAPAGSFTIAGATINGVVATTNPALSLSLAFTAASGIGTVAISTNGGLTYEAGQAYTTTASATLGADGLYTIAVQVTSNAGSVATVSKQVRLDRTGPAISYSITAPTNAGSYDVGQVVTLTDSASDIDNVASIGAVLDATTTVTSGVAFNTETLAAGTHTIVITAKDGLGNVSTTTLTFTVHATIAGLTTAVNDGVTHSKILSSTVATQLKAYLSSAQSALTAGNHTSAKSYLASFVTYVQQQSGITINAAYAALLVGWAQDLIARL
jgi:hypothetical protein